MTDETWTVVAPDGTVTSLDVPWSMMAVPEDSAERERAQAAYHARWRAHHEAVAAAGLAFDTRGTPADGPHGPDWMLWRLRGEAWQATDIGPDPRFAR